MVTHVLVDFLLQIHTLAVIGVLSSVVAAYYYLRIVKVMFFDEPAEPFDKPIGREMAFVQAIAAAFVLLFFIYPAPLVASAEIAVRSLFPG